MTFLGIDTSAYTTSAALVANGELRQVKMLLPVKQGERGLRQSDAVFAHIKQLPEVLSSLFDGFDGKISAVGVTSRPRDAEGSYMPCFLAAKPCAAAFALSYNAPLYDFSHQAGHIEAAAHTCGREMELGDDFLAFHVSGGTTELLRVRRSGRGDVPYDIEIVGRTLDISAGQAIDRAGVMLGCAFPSGPQLEKLAQQSDLEYKPRASVRDGSCNLSGVENQCKKLLDSNIPKRDIARYVLDSAAATIIEMTHHALKTRTPNCPVLFAGGVMCNELIRKKLETRFNAIFALPEYSSDNAAGIALLAEKRYMQSRQ